MRLRYFQTASLTDDSFEIVSLSVDRALQVVVDFQVDKPMDWSNWHIGPECEILKIWGIRGYPTYILVDAEGVIRAHSKELDNTFQRQPEALVMETSS